MINYIIALLLSLGLIFSATEYSSKSNPEKKELHNKSGIVIEDTGSL
jgi:hypothetical protein